MVRLFGFTHDIALGYFSIGCAPGGGHSNIYTFLFNGDVSLSVTMTFVSNIASLGESICIHSITIHQQHTFACQDVHNDIMSPRTVSSVYTIASLVVQIVVSDILSTMCAIVAGVLSGVLSGVLVFVALFLSVVRAALAVAADAAISAVFGQTLLLPEQNCAIFSVNTHRHTNHFRQMRCS